MTGNLPASVGLYALAFWLLLLQPAAIALAVAAGLRRRRAAAGHPWRAAAGGWVAGLLLCALTQVALTYFMVSNVNIVALSYMAAGAIAVGWWLCPISARLRRD